MIIKRMGGEPSFMLTVMSLKENGPLTRQMATAHTTTRMGASTRVHGLTIFRMGKERKPGRTSRHTRGCTKEAKNKVREPTCGLMGRCTRVFGVAIKFKVKASIGGPTAAFTREIGWIIKCTEKEN